MSNWKNFCLDLIGVDQWILRPLPMKKLRVVVSGKTTLPLSPDSKKLLISILKCMHIELKNVMITDKINDEEDISALVLDLENLLENPIQKKDLYAKQMKIIEALSLDREI